MDPISAAVVLCEGFATFVQFVSDVARFRQRSQAALVQLERFGFSQELLSDKRRVGNGASIRIAHPEACLDLADRVAVIKAIIDDIQAAPSGAVIKRSGFQSALAFVMKALERGQQRIRKCVPSPRDSTLLFMLMHASMNQETKDDFSSIRQLLMEAPLLLTTAMQAHQVLQVPEAPGSPPAAKPISMPKLKVRRGTTKQYDSVIFELNCKARVLREAAAEVVGQRQMLLHSTLSKQEEKDLAAGELMLTQMRDEVESKKTDDIALYDAQLKIITENVRDQTDFRAKAGDDAWMDQMEIDEPAETLSGDDPSECAPVRRDVNWTQMGFKALLAPIVEKKIDFLYDERELLGFGGTSYVFRATSIGDRIKHHKKLAFKRFLNQDPNSFNLPSHIAREADMLYRVSGNPNVASLLGVCLQPIGFLFAFAGESTIEKLLFRNLEHFPCLEALPIQPPLLEKLVWIRQLLNAMEHLHACNVVHRDLKPSNVLLKKTERNLSREPIYTVSVIDFGSAREVDASAKGATESAGSRSTLLWGAPEMFAEYSGDPKEKHPGVDTWALGVLITTMITGLIPYAHVQDPTTAKLRQAIQKEPPFATAELARRTSKEFCSLMNRCWDRRIERRPSMTQLLSHYWPIAEASLLSRHKVGLPLLFVVVLLRSSLMVLRRPTED